MIEYIQGHPLLSAIAGIVLAHFGLTAADVISRFLQSRPVELVAGKLQEYTPDWVGPALQEVKAAYQDGKIDQAEADRLTDALMNASKRLFLTQVDLK